MPDYWAAGSNDPNVLKFDKDFITNALHWQKETRLVPAPVIWGSMTNCTERANLVTEIYIPPPV